MRARGEAWPRPVPSRQQRGRLRRRRVRQRRQRARRPAGPGRAERDPARGGQERRAVPGQEARDDRPDALGPRDQDEGRLGLLHDAAGARARPQDPADRAARWSAARARSTAWSTCAATAPTSTPGPPRATPAGPPTRSTPSTSGWRTGRTARTTTAAPAARSRSPATRCRVEPSFQFVQATADTLGVKVLDDYNAESQEGASMMQQNAAGGLRYSASRGYIHDRALPTLSLQTEVHVAKVVIENGRATGVQVIDKDGVAAHHPRRQGGHPRRRRLRVAAAPDALRHRPRPTTSRQHGIPCLADLPVGDNLHDHLFVPLTFHVPTAKHRGTPVALRARPGQGGHPSATRSSRTRSSSPSPSCGRRRRPTYPTCRSTCCRGPTRRPTRTRRSGTRSTRGPCVTLLSTLIYPRSRGTLRLRRATRRRRR